MTIFVCELRWVYANLVEISIVGISYAKFCDWCWLSGINLSLTPLHLMIYRLTMIHINIYYGEPLSNTNPFDGLMFQGLGIQCYYMTMIHINIYYGGPLSNANTELVARPHQFDRHLRQLPCITLCTTMQGKHSPNYTEMDCFKNWTRQIDPTGNWPSIQSGYCKKPEIT